ncbi:hypothetical protein MMC18_006252 [Xylographa bjoerkii]|nr:hypothetical protein [Xylographa bjoerkii]
MESAFSQDNSVAIIDERSAQEAPFEDAENVAAFQRPDPFETTYSISDRFYENPQRIVPSIVPSSVTSSAVLAGDLALGTSSGIGQSVRSGVTFNRPQQVDQASRNTWQNFNPTNRFVQESIESGPWSVANPRLSWIHDDDHGDKVLNSDGPRQAFVDYDALPQNHAVFNDKSGSAIGAWDTDDGSEKPYLVLSDSGYGTVNYSTTSIYNSEPGEMSRQSAYRPLPPADNFTDLDYTKTQGKVSSSAQSCDICKWLFGTKQELLRHMKGVHGYLRPNDRSFLCKGLGCTGRDKIWPRLDNFRSHCRRMHPKEDLVELVKKSAFNQYDGLPILPHGSPGHDASNDLSLPRSNIYETIFSVQVHWNVLDFLREQFDGYTQVALGSIVTLTGTAKLAQATTAGEYLKMHWPISGPALLVALQEAIESHELRSSTTWPELNAKIDVSCFEATGIAMIKIHGALNDPSQITEPLAWIGSAFQLSTEENIRYSEAQNRQVKGIGRPSADYTITFSRFPLSGEELYESNCWHPLFDHGVIARGFPVTERSHQKGLELSLYIMTALGGVQRAFVYQGGVILKGFSAAFVPVERYSDSIQWHMVHNEDGKRLTYQEVHQRCPKRSLLEDVSLECLKHTRAFLGWCSTVRGRLGTADFDYDNIDYAEGLSDSSRDVTITGANLGLSEHASIGLSVAFGRKGSKKHIARSGTFKSILNCAEDTPVVLFDPGKLDRRAWLVSASDVILHIIHTQNAHCPFEVNGSQVELCYSDPETNGWKAGRDAILKSASVMLEESAWPGESAVYFRDRFAGIWSDFEARLGMVEQSIPDGIKVHGTWRHFLRGWQFMDLVDQASSFGYKETTLNGTHGAWVHLVYEIDALVLFASGFHDLFRPLPETKLCPKWKTVPTEKDYLTAGIPMLKRLFAKAGSRLTRKYLAGRLQWHKGCKIFEDYDCCGQYQCDCDRQQDLFYDQWTTIGEVTEPDSLALEQDSGAVVFGKGPPFASLRQPAPRQVELYSQANTNFVHNQEMRSKSSDESIHRSQSSILEDLSQTSTALTSDNHIDTHGRMPPARSAGRSSPPATPPEEPPTETLPVRTRGREKMSPGGCSAVCSKDNIPPEQMMASLRQDVVHHKVTLSHEERSKRLRHTGKLKAVSAERAAS